MAYLAVYDANGETDCRGAVMIHSVCASLPEAQSTVQRIAADSSDLHAFIINECHKWMLVCEPTQGTGPCTGR